MVTRHHSRDINRGFTLVELLVVITIIGLLAAIALPAVNAMRRQAQRIECINNQNQLAKGVISFATRKQQMPGIRSYFSGKPRPTSQTASWPSVVGWVPPLLTDFGRGDLYDLYLTNNTNSVATTGLYVSLFVCPSNQSAAKNISKLSYVVNGGRLNVYPPGNVNWTMPIDWRDNGAFSELFLRTTDAPTIQTLDFIARHDGASMTIMLAENVDATVWSNEPGKGPSSNADYPAETNQAIIWGETLASPDLRSNTAQNAALPNAYARPSSKHGGGYVVAFCDGSTKFISDQISVAVYERLLTSNGKNARIPQSQTLANANQLQPLTERDLNP